MLPLSTSLSPNTEKEDICLALKLLFQPAKWQKGKAIKELEGAFKEYLGVKYAFSFNSGRSAMLAILASIGVQKGDEVLLQAFTCNAAVNPILALGAKPVFVDIDEGLNMDPDDLEKKITEKSRVVVIQHTFGNPAKIEKIKEICEKNNLFLGDESKFSSSPRVNTWVIEDCAHSLGAEYGSQAKRENHPALSKSYKERAGSSTFQPRYSSGKVGTLGDAAFFSFGRDKVISSVYGGMATTNNNQLGQKIERFQKHLDFPSKKWVLQQLLHPISFAIALPLYNIKIGKGILFLKQRLKILSPSVYPEEKKGKLAKYFPKKMPNAMAIMAQNQFKKLERFNKHRREIAKIYDHEFTRMNMRIYANSKDDKSVYMRYPIFVDNAIEIRKRLKEKNIFLDDGWHSLPIVPPGTDLKKMQYQNGSCPKAEKVAKTILNIPTNIHISKEDAEKIVKEIRKCCPLTSSGTNDQISN